MVIRFAIVLSLVVTFPTAAQEKPKENARIQPTAERVTVVTNGTNGRIPKFTGSGDAVVDSVLTDTGSGIRLSGIAAPRFFFDYAQVPFNGSDLTGSMNGQQTLSVGFNSEARYFGTVATLSGRTFYFHDRVAALDRAALDGAGNWWFGPSPTSYGLKIAATNPSSTVTGLSIDASGNVVIGDVAVASSNNLTVHGTVSGNVVQAHYQDVAEWVPSAADLAPGTLVVLDPSSDNTVKASSREYDTTVAGVVSSMPGVILGVPSATKEQIATTGRVKVRVDATRAPIRIGDLLVTSNVPGTAMKSTPLNVSGISMHRPGTIVGKALQALESGEGEILVLLSLQ